MQNSNLFLENRLLKGDAKLQLEIDVYQLTLP